MNINMLEITDFLLRQGFYEVSKDDDYCKIFGKKVDGVMFKYRIILDENYILMQADPVVLFDRWSNSLFEAKFDSLNDFMNNWYRYLENYNYEMDR